MITLVVYCVFVLAIAFAIQDYPKTAQYIAYGCWFVIFIVLCFGYYTGQIPEGFYVRGHKIF